MKQTDLTGLYRMVRNVHYGENFFFSQRKANPIEHSNLKRLRVRLAQNYFILALVNVYYKNGEFRLEAVHGQPELLLSSR
jgi:hypothetical protein